MITDMRDSVSSWPVRILLISLIVIFGGFFGLKSGNKNGLKSGEVASVNGNPIHARDFSFQYQNLVQSYQKQGKLPADIPESIYGMLKQQLLSSLIYQKLKAGESKHLGLSPSNEKVKEIIKKQFSDADGKFDFKFYENFLRNQMGKTPGQYEELQRENIRADLFEEFILDTGIASNIQLKQSYKQSNEKVSLSFVKINPANTMSVRPKPKPATPDELQKYYTDHADEFKTKEKRKLDIAFFDKKTFAKSSNFSKEAETLLQEFSSKYDNLNDAVAKDPRLQRITTGLISYEDLALPLSSSELTEVLNSTQNLEVGKGTVLVSRDGGKVFLTKLLELQQAKLPEFASVRDRVEKSYLQNGDLAAYDAWVQTSWSAITSGSQSLDAFAKKIGQPAKDTEAFAYASTNVVPTIGTNEEVMTEAFAVSKDAPFFSKPIKIDNDYVMIKLKNKTEPDWAKFEKEQDALANALYQQNAKTRFTAWMDNVEKHSKIKRELDQPARPVEE